jgi:transposase
MAREFLRLKRRPTGLCIVNDYVALAFITEVLRAGVAVPRDLSIVGHENQRITKFSPVRLTSISQPLEDIVNAVAELVMQRLAGSDGPPQTVIVRGRLVEGESVADGPVFSRHRANSPAPDLSNSSRGAVSQGEVSTGRGSHITLNAEQQSRLERLLADPSTSIKARQRVRALLELGRGRSLRDVANRVGVSYNTVVLWRDAYREAGLAFLQDKPRSGRPPRISGTQRSQITALASAPPPEGHNQWSLRLLAEKAVELKLVEQISHNQVAKILREAEANQR